MTIGCYPFFNTKKQDLFTTCYLHCKQNILFKKEFEDHMSEIKTQLVVLGAGPGGYAAAFRAAD